MSVKHNPQNVHMAFDNACAGMGHNQVAWRLNQSIDSRDEIITAFKDMGQFQVTPLSSKFADARVALAFYAGNGIVAKVIPDTFYENVDDVHAIPPITSDTVYTEMGKFIIDTYPFIEKGDIKARDVEDTRSRLSNIGLTFNNEYGNSRNLHRMPDRNGTVVSIDSGNFIREDSDLQPETLKEQWHAYMTEIFPIYGKGRIDPQSNDTTHEFMSLHNPHTDIIGFDLYREDPIIRESQEHNNGTTSKRGNFWSMFVPKRSEFTIG